MGEQSKKHIKAVVDGINKFFLSTLPFSQTKGPFSTAELEGMFNEANWCQQVGGKQEKRKELSALEDRWPLCQAPKVLFLALCDNMRVNYESLEKAGQMLDRSSVPDMESSLCARQRNHFREVFLAAGEVSRLGDGWVILQAYNLLLEISRWEGRGESRLTRMLEEKPETLVATFLVDQREEVRMAQDRVADLVIRKGNLLKLHHTCNNDLLARVCSQAEGRQVILKLTSRAMESVNGVVLLGEVIINLVSNPLNTEPRLLLEGLEEALTSHSKFLKSELLNYLSVRLR